MKTKQLNPQTFIFAGIFIWLAVSSQVALATTFDFTITFTNLSNNVLTPVPFITHNTDFDLFSNGSAASTAVEDLAENGIASGVINLAQAARASGHVLDYTVASNGGPIGPGGSVTFNILANDSHGLLSFMSMLAFSNDAFIGGTTYDGAISLFSVGIPVLNTYSIASNYVWDAGTEINDEIAAHVPALGGGTGVDEGGIITLGHSGISGLADIDSERNWLSDPFLASIEISAANPVPIPSAIFLFGTGLVGLIGLSRRKR